ncbi:hypothetical protein WBP06_00640 [Novosphingobium sp. BL-8H]|uniref:hypothetical protein n=1 Tax=Novosphingobium sp. BL-8H TaxID=3127640 RepID=UPI00375668EA
MLSVIGKTAWFALAAVIAVPVVGVEMDRQARRDDAVAAHVPAPFRYFALEPLIDQAYTRQDIGQGVALSRDYVRRRPIPSDGLALLAYGQVQRGDEDAAVHALLLAGQRGWRNRFTQDMLVVMAFQAQDWNVAAQRLLALWRVGVSDDRLKAMTADLLAHPDGTAAFAGQLGQEKDWSGGFIAWAGATLDQDALRRTVGAMARHGARVDCATLATRLPALVRAGRPAAAGVLWGELCAGGRMTAADDFRFQPAADGKLPGPFDWQFPEVEGIERTFDKGGTVVVYSNRTAVRSPIARRSAVLAPGRYTAGADAETEGEAGVRPLLLRITCYSARGEEHRLADIAIGTGARSAAGTDEPAEAGAFTIPAEACQTQDLALLTGRGEGRIRRVSIVPQ